MNRGIYIASTGMLAAQAQSEVVADNIANLRTPGYKEEHSIKETFPSMLLSRLESLIPYKTSPIGERGDGVTVSGVARINTMGLLDKTDRQEDLALVSGGYFTVSTPNGERYTRNGHFQISETGRLTTAEGYPVLGMNGEITGLTKDFRVAADGGVYVNDKIVDRLRIMQIPEGSLRREGDSLYSSSQNPEIVDEIQVLQGTLEKSNVDLAGQMEKMMVVMRAYEANQKVIQAQDAALDKAVNEIGKV